MANFLRAPGDGAQAFNVSTGILSGTPGLKTEISLWGGDPVGKPLVVRPNTPGIITIDEYTGPPTKSAPNTRTFKVTCLAAGNVMVEARIGSTSGPVYAYFQAAISRNTSSDQAMLAALAGAVEDGDLAFDNYPERRDLFLRTAAGERFLGRKVVYATPILNLLTSLVAGGRVNLMRAFMYPKGGPHGIPLDSDTFLCKAIDIAGYRGIPVTLSQPSTAIQVVTQILRNFPSGRFDIGYPRPIGGSTGFDPSQDVFFPVPDQATAQLCWDNRISRPLSAMKQPAQDAVRAAQNSTHATFVVQYPDGVNHMHISVSHT